MTDKKFTDKEIIKALEICQDLHDDDTCRNCLYNSKIYGGCRDGLCNDVLDLLNRQQAEIEQLKSENEQLQLQLTAKETTLGGTYIDVNSHYRDIKKLQSELTAYKSTDLTPSEIKSLLSYGECGESIIGHCNMSGVVADLKTENARLKAERDKAVEDISRRWICKSCIHLTKHHVWGELVWGDCPKRKLVENEDFNDTCANFVWRGLEDNDE